MFQKCSVNIHLPTPTTTIHHNHPFTLQNHIHQTLHRPHITSIHTRTQKPLLQPRQTQPYHMHSINNHQKTLHPDPHTQILKLHTHKKTLGIVTLHVMWGVGWCTLSVSSGPLHWVNGQGKGCHRHLHVLKNYKNYKDMGARKT